MIYKLIGVGIGPSNLSLAALIKSKPKILNETNVLFFDKKKIFNWHEYQMFSGSLMQNSFLRDLVTPLMPTSNFSFLNYLKSNNKLYQFLNAGISLPFREEYSEYMKWVSDQLEYLNYSSEVKKISFNNSESLFHVELKNANSLFRTENVVIGTGIAKKIPFDYPKENNKIIHVSDFLKYKPTVSNKIITVIGSGQSSAELMMNLLSNEKFLPKKIFWITRDTNFRALDTGNFSREFYTQEYAQIFFSKNKHLKKIINKNERNAGQGISPSLMNELYRRIYYLKNVKRIEDFIELRTELNVESIKLEDNLLSVITKNLNDESKFVFEKNEYVFCCTGFKTRNLNFIEDFNSDYETNYDYSVKRFGKLTNKLYLQSYSSKTHSLSDPNLSMAAVRNGFIVNEISKEKVFSLPEDDLVVKW